ncbi:MAG: ABC transporter ATP-binding protein [Bdellovibrionaceae bacterium]|nr:ABC transporter ATP-binding protein [Pseudobdellovibrionaceae bacterium]
MKYTIQFIKKELLQFKLIFIFALLLGVISGVAKSASPYIINQLMNSVWTTNNYSLNYSIIMCLLFSLTWVISAVARFFNTFIIAKLTETLMAKLKQKIFNACVNLNPSLFLQKFPKGASSILSQSLGDLQIISAGINNLSTIFREPFLLLFSAIYIIYIDWKLLALLAVVFPLISFLNKKFIYLLKSQNHSNLELQEDVTQNLKEGLEGLRTIHSFDLQEELTNNFKTKVVSFLNMQKRIFKKELAISPLSEIFMSLSMSIILLYVGHQIMQKHLSIADFTSFLFAATLLQASFKQLQTAMLRLQKVEVALERLATLFEKTSNNEQLANKKTKPLKPWSSIKINNLSYTYPNSKNPALKNINFELKKNTSLAIVGESGSGKSTLVKLIQGFLPPQQGSIYFGEQNIAEVSSKELLSNISLVDQNIFLFSASIKENILYGNIQKKHDANLEEDIISAAKLADAHQFITEKPKAYNSFLNVEGNELSGGQRQRLNIARALFKNAPLLILDEASSALDAKSAEAIQSTIDKLIPHTTSLIITHKLHSLKTANHIIVLDKGSVAEQGSHAELMQKKSLYFRLAVKQGISLD